MIIASKLKIFITVITLIVTAGFLLPWIENLNGKYLFIDVWQEKKGFGYFIGIPSRLFLAGLVFSFIILLYKTFLKKMNYGRNAAFYFWLPMAWLLLYLLANFSTMYTINGGVKFLSGYKIGFFIVLVCTVALGIAGNYIFGNQSTFKNRPVKPMQWVKRILLLLGLVYPCIICAIYSGDRVFGFFWQMAWLHLIVALVFWILFIKYRFARLFFTGIAIWGLILLLLDYNFPDAARTNFFIEYAHKWTAYVIVVLFFIMGYWASQYTCPSCRIFYSGNEVGTNSEGSRTKTQTYSDHVNVGTYRREANADLSQTMWLKDSANTTVIRTRQVSTQIINHNVVCRECGHEWNFISTMTT